MARDRSTPHLSLCAVVVATIAWAVPARAQTATPGVALDQYEPSERGSEWFVNDSLDLRGNLRPALGVTFDYGYRPYVLENPDGSTHTVVVADQLFLHAGGSLILADRLRLAFSLPIALTEGGSSATVGGQSYATASGGGLGDLRLAADVRLLGGGPFTLAAGVRAWLPTGDASRYLGDGSIRIGPHVSAAGDVGPLAYAATIGVLYRDNSQGFNGHPGGSEAVFSLAAGLRADNGRLLIGPELWGSTVVAQGDAVLGARTTPLALLISGHETVGSFRVGLGAGPGLSPAAGTAAFRAVASIEWAPPFEAAAAKSPPPTDRDGDSVADIFDACPDVAGVATDDPNTNGCPSDRDKDGIADSIDACPDVAGVKTDDPKTNGCPSDRDKDSIPDAVDACPDIAGVKTDDPKTNGCPSDRDKDGIVDSEDACPDAPGPRDPDPKKNGCPIARVEAGQVKIVQQINFKTNSAIVLAESQPIIDAVAKILKEHPEIKHLRVEGHTDDVGAAQTNLRLSKLRAASVVKALVKAGVDKGRMTSQGFGQEKPIDSNATDSGRANNRRVEFHIESDK